MSDVPDPAEAVTEELSDQISVGDLVGDGNVVEQLDVESLGRTAGKSLGAVVGRRLGRAVGIRLAEKLAFWRGDGEEADEKGDRSPLSRVGHALAVALGRTLENPEIREPIEDSMRGLVRSAESVAGEAAETAESAAEGAVDTTESAAEEATDAADEATDAAEETEETAESAVDEAADAAEGATGTAEDAAEGAASTAEDAAEGAASTAEGAAETAAEAAPGLGDDVDASALDAEDVESIREETYRDLLETMDYSEIQSIAKDAGVKANQKREDMIDDIVENFEAGEGDGESADDGDGESDEAAEGDNGEEAKDDGDEDEAEGEDE